MKRESADGPPVVAGKQNGGFANVKEIREMHVLRIQKRLAESDSFVGASRISASFDSPGLTDTDRPDRDLSLQAS